MSIGNCSPINGGNVALGSTAIHVEANVGWYRGSGADVTFIPRKSTEFIYENTSGLQFTISVVDAFCPGDSLFVGVYTPTGIVPFLLADFPFSFVISGNLFTDCNQPAIYTTDPSVAFTQPNNFAQGVFFSSVLSPSPVGTWTVRVESGNQCPIDPVAANQIGYFVRIDEIGYTAPICSFNNTVITSYSSSSLPSPSFNKNYHPTFYSDAYETLGDSFKPTDPSFPKPTDPSFPQPTDPSN